MLFNNTILNLDIIRMIILYIDKNPEECAKQVMDKHISVIILEYANLLCTAKRVLSLEIGEDFKRLYNHEHLRHEVARWARYSKENYTWALKCFEALLEEYRYRFKKVHKSEELLEKLKQYPKVFITENGFTEPPRLRDKTYWKDSGTLESMREYYMQSKRKFAIWTGRIIPYWFK